MHDLFTECTSPLPFRITQLQSQSAQDNVLSEHDSFIIGRPQRALLGSSKHNFIVEERREEAWKVDGV